MHLNRVQQLSYITRKLKMLAQYLNVPILTLSQLNRSIEMRINKQPILSDLKESGCINCNMSINIIKIYDYILYITSLPKYLNQLYFLNSYLIKSNILMNNYISNINFSYEYIFNIIYLEGFIQLTHHHKCLYYNTWLNIQKFVEDTKTMLVANQSMKLKMQYSLLYSIEFINYNFVYDLLMNSSVHFTCKNLILHNSIEQDADIVLMLYQKNVDDKNHFQNTNQEIVDLVISKNRHGPIGSCQLVFCKENTSFKDLQDNDINNHLNI
jgi:replicative DNA helicase